VITTGAVWPCRSFVWDDGAKIIASGAVLAEATWLKETDTATMAVAIDQRGDQYHTGGRFIRVGSTSVNPILLVAAARGSSR
jgi:hypothetical protein